jgi:acyl-ACP thioesterase
VRPQKVLPEGFHAQSPHVLPLTAESLATLDAATVERRFNVRFSDIDVNLHVTNTSYIAWVLESVEESNWRKQWLTSLDIQFLSECSLGAAIWSRSRPIDEGFRSHSITREDDAKELARAVTLWKTK